MPRLRRPLARQPEDYSPTQVADLHLLQLGRSQIYDYIRAGMIETVRDDWNHIRITRAEITRLQKLWKIDPAKTPVDKTLVQAAHRAASAKGGHERAAHHSREEMAEQLKRGQREAWIREIDPGHILPPAELERRLQQKQAAKMEDMRHKRIVRDMLREQYSNHPA